MLRQPATTTVLAVTLLLACACDKNEKPTAERDPSSAAPSTEPAPEPTAAAPKPAVPFSHDDFTAALERAKKAKKALFVDVWAPWCHTCLSMQSYVLTDPSLAPLAERVEFVAIDTDKEANGGFLEKYTVQAWPTFFTIDPTDGALLGMWPGAASAKELRELVQGSLEAMDLRRAKKLPKDSPLARLLAAKTAQAAGQYDEAAAQYEAVLGEVDEAWPRRSEALFAWLQSLHAGGKVDRCAAIGREHLTEVKGAALPADFTRYYLGCLEARRKAPELRESLDAIIAHLEKLTSGPLGAASVDDRSDALDILADAYLLHGRRGGWRRAQEKRLELMEKAAADAPTPQVAQTHDYARANAYVALGRPTEAVAMLSERERQLPESYEPPARLASVLADLGRLEEALSALDRALPNAYGPRRLKYLAQKSDIQRRLRDFDGELATLRQEVEGWKSLSGGLMSKQSLEDAERRLRLAQERNRRLRARDRG